MDKNGEYREQVKRLVTDYDNYISLNSQEMMRTFQKKWLVIRQNWTKFTQRASKSRRKSGSVVLVMEYKSAGIHGSIKVEYYRFT